MTQKAWKWIWPVLLGAVGAALVVGGLTLYKDLAFLHTARVQQEQNEAARRLIQLEQQKQQLPPKQAQTPPPLPEKSGGG